MRTRMEPDSDGKTGNAECCRAGQQKERSEQLHMESGFWLREEVSMRQACTAAENYLASCGNEDAAVDAWYLLEYVTGISRAVYLAERDRKISEEQRDAYAALVNRRGAHIPLQHLTGEQEFMGLPFLVSESVLIPRQDTETLVELALEKIKECLRPGTARNNIDAAETYVGSDRRDGGSKTDGEGSRSYRVLDLCTGSGCIAVSIAKLWGQGQTGRSGMEADGAEKLEVYASDLSEEALEVARENARRLGMEVRFFQSDLFARIPMPEGGHPDEGAGECGFDMIVSNPPYIRTQVIGELSEEVRLHEPRLALDGGEDGLAFYRSIICGSRDYLCLGGWLLLEIGYDQGTAVSGLLQKNGFSNVRVTKDLSGNDRVVSGQKREVQAGGRRLCLTN